MRRFPRTIRLDISDTRVYERAAEPGEWAVSGAFVFAGRDPEQLSAKERQAFARGFLGVSSFGWSTFVQVAEISEDEYRGVVELLARRAVHDFGAPDRDTAITAAREEAEFVVGLCQHKIHTLLGVEREIGSEGIVERFRVIAPPRDMPHARIWDIVADEENAAPAAKE